MKYIKSQDGKTIYRFLGVHKEISNYSNGDKKYYITITHGYGAEEYYTEIAKYSTEEVLNIVFEDICNFIIRGGHMYECPTEEVVEQSTAEVVMIKSILTKPRVDKLMHKLVDEELLTREDFVMENMSKLLKLLGSRVIEDMMKEESDILGQFEESFLKIQIGKILPLVLKEVLKDYE